MTKDLTNTPQLGRPRLSDSVLDHLTNQILAGSLKPGDELPSEVELAKAFQVSKPTVRDALRHLSTLGVVDIRQGRPTTVGTLRADALSQFFRFAVAGTRNKFRDVIRLRRALECIAAPIAAETISDAEADVLRAILAKLEAYKHDHDQWVFWDARFHLHIATMSRNVLLPYLMEALLGVMEDTIRALHTRRIARDPEKTYQRHVDLTAAITAHDSARAHALMAEHFDASLILIEMEEAETDGDPSPR